MESLVELIDRWHFEWFHGSAAAADTRMWNLVYAAKEDLKNRLVAVRKCEGVRAPRT